MCDLGEEYTSNAFRELFTSHGTIQHTSCTDTPKKNCVTRENIDTLLKLLILF